MSHIEAKKKDVALCGHPSRLSFEEEVSPSEALFFHQGIIGFGNDQRYTLTPFPKAEFAPLQLLIHHQNPTVHFLTLCESAIGARYHLSGLGEMYQQLGYNPSTTKCYFIVTVMGQGRDLLVAINQRAPVFIDHAGKRGGQHIMPQTQLPLSLPLPEFSVDLRMRMGS